MSGKDKLSAEQMADLTRAAFDVLKLVADDRTHEVNELLDRVHRQHGVEGMMRLCQALATMVAEMTNIAGQLAELRRGLDTDQDATVVALFSPEGRQGLPATFDDEVIADVGAALHLICVTLEGPTPRVHRYLIDLFRRGPEAVQNAMTGLIVLMEAVVGGLDESERLAVVTYRPMSSGALATASERWEVTEYLRTKILEATALPDTVEAATQSSAILGPIVTAYGEQAVLAICRMFAAELVTLLGFDQHQAVYGDVGLKFSDLEGRQMDLDGAPDEYVRCVKLAYEFVDAYARDDQAAQMRMACSQERTSAGAQQLLTGLTYVYRQQRLYRQEIPQ